MGLKQWAYLGIVLALVGALSASHVAAYNAGKQAERTAALTQSVDVLRERSKTNATVKNLGDDALCRELGGVWNGSACQ